MEYLSHTLNLAIIYVALTVSLNLILGFAGIASMSHAAFFCIGGYVSVLVTMHWGLNFAVGLVAATVLTGIFGGVLAGPFIKIKDEYVILFTLAFQMISFHLMLSLYNVTGGDSGIFGVPPVNIFGFTPSSPTAFLPISFLFIFIVYYVCYKVTRSPFGRVLKGIREDASAVTSLGKSVLKFKVLTFMVGSGLAAAAGSLFAHYSQFINPTIGHLDGSVLLIAMVVLGGSANLWGSAVGAFLLIIIPELLTFIPGASNLIVPLRSFIYGLLLILFMRFRPEGLVPEYRGLARKKYRLDPELEAAAKKGETAELAAAPVANEVVLEARGLDKSFGGLKAVDNFSLELRQGQITALVGPNGCGKTTAFNLITGFLRPDQGSVLLRGREITGLTAHRRAQVGIARSWQDVRIFQHMTVLDNVLLARQSRAGEKLFRLFLAPWTVGRQRRMHHQAAYQYLEVVGLLDKAGEIAKNLSYAEQKLLAVARLLATEANVLLFDEPSSGVDPNWVQSLMGLIRRLARRGKTICIVEHNLEVVKEISDLVYFMADGKALRQGTAQELMADPQLKEIYFGV